MSKILVIILVILIPDSALFPQQYFIRGTVKSREGKELLGFANIRVENSTAGTAANKNGEYELRLAQGSYSLIASYIGYRSDTIRIKLTGHLEEINFNLSRTKIDLPEIVVKPGENPALEIIRKAIARKKSRDEFLKSYEFEAYTKGIIRSEEDLRGESNSVTIGAGVNDTADLKITGILENQSKGYFKKPDNYKEIITARKQTANFPPAINILTGGRIIKNFYEDRINFFGTDLPGPLNEDALEYYYYYIQELSAIDNNPVYRIYMEPDDPSDPGFTGSIYIKDYTFDLIQVDLMVNRAANRGGILDTINIFQQFSSVDDSVYMPADFRLSVTANVLSLARFGFELNTILYNYKINPYMNDGLFDKAVITVLPEADEKDSVYWTGTQTIPNTDMEYIAYKRIDSIQNAPRSFLDDFSPLSTGIRWTENFSTSAPLTMYHFNRIEGHTPDLGLFYEENSEKRLNSSLRLSYGFADRNTKQDFTVSYLLGDYRTTKLELNAFNRLNILFENSDSYNEWITTVLALFSKYEFRDYYYSRGFDFEISSEIFPVLQLSAGFLNRTDKNAYVNSDFSFFAQDKRYRDNPPVLETRINALKAGFTLDFRDYIEDGFFRRRIAFAKDYIIFEGNVTFSNISFLKSKLDFTKYELTARGTMNTFRSAGMNYTIYGTYTDGTLPYQMLYALPGNIDLTSRSVSFRTLDLNEVLGDKILTMHFEHDFKDELFRLFRVPLLKDLELRFTSFLNIALSETHNETTALLQKEINSFKHPFYEAGFGLGHLLIPLQLEFAWKLNYRGENNFRIGINTFIYY